MFPLELLLRLPFRTHELTMDDNLLLELRQALVVHDRLPIVINHRSQGLDPVFYDVVDAIADDGFHWMTLSERLSTTGMKAKRCSG